MTEQVRSRTSGADDGSVHASPAGEQATSGAASDEHGVVEHSVDGTADGGTADGGTAADGSPAVLGILRGWTRRQRALLIALPALTFAIYAVYALRRHARFETTGFDLGIFDQVVRSYARFGAPVSPLKDVDYNILGDHFHPLLAVLAPLYWVWDDPRMLLLAQAALFAVSILPVVNFARRRLGPWPALLVGAAYGLCWPLQRAVDFDFHEIALAVPLIALLLDALDRRAYRTVVACSLLLMLDREDMGTLVLLVGLFVALQPVRPGGRRWRHLAGGAALAGAGVLGYWLATSVIIPAMGPQGFTYWTFTALGPDPVSALRYMVTHPVDVLRLMVTPDVKVHTLQAIFVPTGYFAVASPYVIFTLPFLAQRMLNDRELLWQTGFHYTSVIAPVLMVAAVDTLDRLVRLLRRLIERADARAAASGEDAATPVGSVARRWRRVPALVVAAWVAWTVGSVAVGTTDMFSDYRIANLWQRYFWTDDDRVQAVRQILPMIPEHECVEADNQLAPQLTPRDYVLRVDRSQGKATWLVLDMGQATTGWQTPLPRDALEIAESTGFTTVAWRGDLVLLHRDIPVDPICRG